MTLIKVRAKFRENRSNTSKFEIVRNVHKQRQKCNRSQFLFRLL